MKLIIDIPEKTYQKIKERIYDYGDMNVIIQNGTPYEERPHENWEYLKELITEMRDADGELNQKQTCQFILELMGVIEREGDRNDGQ